jgi:cytochrome b
MTTIHHIRLYHAILAIFAILSYLTAEYGIIHLWLGYGVIVIFSLRIIWGFFGDPQFGLKRFYPSFVGLKITNFFSHLVISKILILSIVLSLIGVSYTGILMDKGRAIGLKNLKLFSKYSNSNYQEIKNTNYLKNNFDIKENNNNFDSQQNNSFDNQENHHLDRHKTKDHHGDNKERKNHKQKNYLKEVHEFFANLMLIFVAIHVVYLFSFKNFMAKYMLFINVKNIRKK